MNGQVTQVLLRLQRGPRGHGLRAGRRRGHADRHERTDEQAGDATHAIQDDSPRQAAGSRHIRQTRGPEGRRSSSMTRKPCRA